MLRLAAALFAIQAGFHGFTAALPLALDKAGISDPEIGLIVGVSALVQLPSTIAAGALIDRFGGRRLVAFGAMSYVVAAVIMMLPGVDAARDRLPFIIARLFQGLGMAAALPAMLSLVPTLVPTARRGFALAFVSSAHNLTLVVLPPLSLVILAASSISGVAAVNGAFVLVGFAILFAAPLRHADDRDDSATTSPRSAVPGATERVPSGRRLGIAFRSSWIRPMAIMLLYIGHWGVIAGYLPQRAAAAGADIGLFFAFDGLAVLLSRIPTGWLADRLPPRWLVLIGLFVTAMAIGLLVLPPTTPILIAAGLMTGGGAGLVLTPLLVEMSHRSDDVDRGSAFALYSTGLASSLIIGSIGFSPIIAFAGFEAAIAVTIGGIVCSGILTALDPLLGRPATDRASAAIA